ncbi:MAG TPA: hypothetical protein VF885_12655 [Arthrobacter sp.]
MTTSIDTSSTDADANGVDATEGATTTAEPDAAATAATDAAGTDATDAAAATGTPKVPTAEELLEAQRKKNSENKALRQTNKDLQAQLAEFNAWKESQKTEEQRNQEAHEALVAENAKLKTVALRAEIKRDFKDLPDEIVELLQGNDNEEIRAHAERLAPLFVKAATPPAPAPKPAVNPGQRVVSGASNTDDAVARQFFANHL